MSIKHFAPPALCLVLLSACSSATSENTSLENGSAEELSSATVVGDWSDLPSGDQCITAVRAFVERRFGTTIPSMPDAWSGECGPTGACHLWVDDLMPSASWERVVNDGTNVPETYSVIVYPPHGSNEWGHVALVDHVENGQIYVMDDNYVGHLERSATPHTVSTKAYGWYRRVATPSCSTDSDCNGGQDGTERVCGDDGACLTGCHSDQDCAAGTHCSETSPHYSCQ